ncbi:MAG: amidohydrolase family protein [Acidobacteria bacterium]|nr:amidohydrolase family protein [Acidobacteriota bacterium]
MKSVIIRNIGSLVSGDLARPLLEADALFIEDGKIAQIGAESRFSPQDKPQIIDAAGTTVVPGLLDSHVHPVAGDFTPRQRMLDFIESCLHGGVTAMISAGEVHFPGRPRDASGAKALALLAHKSFANLRPAGVKVYAGALMLEKGLQENDFQQLAAEGVHLVGEVGLGTVKDPAEAAEMVQWAKKYNMRVTIHTGGPSIPGSTRYGAEEVIRIRPHIIGHINGGPTAISTEDVEQLVLETDFALEIVQCGNFHRALDTIRFAREHHALARVIVGNDAPSGSGVIPLGILRTLNFLACFGGIPAEQCIAFATGNTRRVHGLSCGLVQEGADADLVILDAPEGSTAETALQAIEVGDIPGVSLVMIDGRVLVQRSRNTPPARRMAHVVGQPAPVSAH